MKKIYGFLGAAALLMLAACSKDGAAADPDSSKGTGSGGDFYMSVAVTPVGGIGTRTTTGSQGKEVGQDYENNVSEVLVILAKGNAGSYESLMVLEPTLVGGNSNYTSTWTEERDEVVDALSGVSNLYVFVVANPTGAMKTAAKTDNKIQDLFNLTADAKTYWTADKFVMTNSKVKEAESSLSTIGNKGSYSTPEDPFKLGTIEIQRAVSRFDVSTNKLVFNPNDSESELTGVTVTFDAVALINQATSANLFKVTAANNTGYTAGTTLAFADESSTNYVLSPVQTAFSLALYKNTATVENGTMTKPVGDRTNGQNNFAETFFNGEPFASSVKPVDRVNGYTLLNDLSDDDNAEFTHPNDTQYAGSDTYKIWRYCMENTNYPATNQLHGNTTGVVFRAQLTDAPSTGEPQGSGVITSAAGAPIYAFNNIIYGDGMTLKAYATNEENDGELAAINFKGALAAAEMTADNVTSSTSFEGTLDAKLVELGFSIYRAEGGKYYAYYIYWNRHNDNNDKNEMGPMEFATVRNNVYKLRVSSVKRLGHPADPNDDPDPDDPGDEDEQDELYFNVVCQILPWEVRMNGIEF